MQADDLIKLDQFVDEFKAQLKKTNLSVSTLEGELRSIKKEIKKSIGPKLSPGQERGVTGWLKLIEAHAERYGDCTSPSSEFELRHLSSIESEISKLICNPEVVLVILQSEYRKDPTISAAISKCDKAFRSSFDPLAFCAILQEIEEQAQIIALGMIAPALTNCYGNALEQQFALMSRNKLIEFYRGFFSIEMTQWVEGLWAFINMGSMTAVRTNRIVVNAMRILQRFEQARYSVLGVFHAKEGTPSPPLTAEKSHFLLSSKRNYSNISAKDKQAIELAISIETKRDVLYQNNISIHVEQEAADSDALIKKTAALTIVFSYLKKPIKNAFEAISLALGFFSFNASSFIYHLNSIEEYACNMLTSAKTHESSRGILHAPLGDYSTPYIVVLQVLLCKLTKGELIKFADKIYKPSCEGFYRALWAMIYDTSSNLLENEQPQNKDQTKLRDDEQSQNKDQSKLQEEDPSYFDNHVRGKITKSILQFEILRDVLDLVLMMRGLQPRNILANKKERQFSPIDKSTIPQRSWVLAQDVISHWKTTIELIQDRHAASSHCTTLNRL